ncbi:hypothetical protein BGZ61DRAFT_454818, partial [Ilyonectria robusta]|uniref:uncharacterized protein n=1 Tax=Ilyonectria robusta TaxID=1079257 RepID=UPI001E8D73AD
MLSNNYQSPGLGSISSLYYFNRRRALISSKYPPTIHGGTRYECSGKSGNLPHGSNNHTNTTGHL